MFSISAFVNCVFKNGAPAFGGHQPVTAAFNSVISQLEVQHIAGPSKKGKKQKGPKQYAQNFSVDTGTTLNAAETIISAIGAETGLFTGQLQEDAEEFLLVALNCLHQEMICDKLNDKSAIKNIFAGETCINGKVEPFMTLKLNIQKSYIVDLHTAFQFTFKDVKIGNINIISKVKTLPPVLILTLNRFCFTKRDGAIKVHKNIKIDEVLEIPEEVLAPELKLLKSNSKKYKLCAVVYHDGGLNLGHYTSDVYYGNQWLRFNDGRVDTCKSPAEISFENVERNAYVLFYRRKDTFSTHKKGKK